MAQQLKALTVLSEDLGSIPSTTWKLIKVPYLHFQRSTPLFWLMLKLGMFWYTVIHVGNILIYITFLRCFLYFLSEANTELLSLYACEQSE